MWETGEADEVLGSAQARAFNRRIQAFCDRGEALEEEYHFDFDDFLFS